MLTNGAHDRNRTGEPLPYQGSALPTELRGPQTNECLVSRQLQKMKASAFVFGAGDETRTRDIQLGRLKLYQLSYSRPANRQFIFLMRNDKYECKFAPTITGIRSMQEVM
jgi:hypothetical protein